MTTLNLEGQSTELTVSFATLQKLTDANVDPLKVGVRVASGTIPSSIEIIEILWVGSDSGKGIGLSRDKFVEAILHEGIQNFVDPVVSYLMEYLVGSEQPVPKKAKAVAKKKKKKSVRKS